MVFQYIIPFPKITFPSLTGWFCCKYLVTTCRQSCWSARWVREKIKIRYHCTQHRVSSNRYGDKYLTGQKRAVLPSVLTACAPEKAFRLQDPLCTVTGLTQHSAIGVLTLWLAMLNYTRHISEARVCSVDTHITVCPLTSRPPTVIANYNIIYWSHSEINTVGLKNNNLVSPRNSGHKHY